MYKFFVNGSVASAPKAMQRNMVFMSLGLVTALSYATWNSIRDAKAGSRLRTHLALQKNLGNLMK